MTRIILDSTDLEELGRLPIPATKKEGASPPHHLLDEGEPAPSVNGASSNAPEGSPLLPLLQDIEKVLRPGSAGTYLRFTNLRKRVQEAIAELEAK